MNFINSLVYFQYFHKEGTTVALVNYKMFYTMDTIYSFIFFCFSCSLRMITVFIENEYMMKENKTKLMEL